MFVTQLARSSQKFSPVSFLSLNCLGFKEERIFLRRPNTYLNRRSQYLLHEFSSQVLKLDSVQVL